VSRYRTNDLKYETFPETNSKYSKTARKTINNNVNNPETINNNVNNPETIDNKLMYIANRTITFNNLIGTSTTPTSEPSSETQRAPTSINPAEISKDYKEKIRIKQTVKTSKANKSPNNQQRSTEINRDQEIN
jgi:hypothetical protein